jgi:hypothetical protein
MCCALAAGDHTIVTTDTTTNHLRMIHGRYRNRLPGYRTHGMATITLVATVYVSSTPATGNHTIMATDTATQHLRMINRSDGNWRPWIWSR